jgi:hypothetical protein
MKAKVSKVNNFGIVKTFVLTGTFNGKTIELGVTNTNTTFLTVCNNKLPKNGDEIEVDDNAIQAGSDPKTGLPTGRYFIARTGAEKTLQAVKMMQAQNIVNSFTV